MNADQSSPAAVKSCCSAVYDNDLVRLVLGDSYHPGGRELTRHLARLMDLRPGQKVLDVACGPGTSAAVLREEFGVQVMGVDLSGKSLERARTQAAGRDRPAPLLGAADAENLPFASRSFDAVLCECALSTFPGKAAAASEFRRVLRTGGRLGLSDVTVDKARLDPRLLSLAGQAACVGGALSAAGYRRLLEAAGFSVIVSEAHDQALLGMVQAIAGRIKVLAMVGSSGMVIDPVRLIGLTEAATRAVAEGAAGYHLTVAERP
ncbi:MAG: DVU_1556 family methyltransferase [Actinomycetota bacterium]